MGSNNNPGKGRRLAFLWGVPAIVVLAILIGNMRSPPQLKADEEVFNTVDALFTALTSRDHDRLDECERRLLEYRESGKLSAKPARLLDGVIQQARAENWEPAAQRLYVFMYGQRGE